MRFKLVQSKQLKQLLGVPVPLSLPLVELDIEKTGSGTARGRSTASGTVLDRGAKGRSVPIEGNPKVGCAIHESPFN